MCDRSFQIGRTGSVLIYVSTHKKNLCLHIYSVLLTSHMGGWDTYEILNLKI
jgi:hypothetical protein